MSVEKDILDAQVLTGGINYYKDKRLYNFFATMYPFTTENIGGYFKTMNLANKSLLTVGSSADQILNAILLDCKDITCVDVNPFVKYYFGLKMGAILALSYSEFLNFFIRDKLSGENSNVFSIKTYYKISPYLSKSVRHFWDNLYLEFDPCEFRNNLFHCDEVNLKGLEKANLYMNEQNYALLKEKLMNPSVSFINCDIRKFPKENQKKFDYILLSNIPCYLEEMYQSNHIEKYKAVVDDLSEHLTKNGKIMMAYLYDTKKNTSYKPDWSIIYDLNKVTKIFGKENLQLKTFTGVRGYMFETNKIKDSALFYRKTQNDTDLEK